MDNLDGTHSHTTLLITHASNNL